MPRVPLTPIDDRVAKGFSAGSEAYTRSRPEYPPAALRFVTRTFSLGPGKVVVDIGAGTGKWTRQLVKTGAEVIAVEPLAAMRKELRRTVPGVRVLGRRGEETGLADGCADLVTVAQAFHWLEARRALAEFHRLLRPGGGVAIVYNWRRQRGRMAREIGALREGYRPKRDWKYGQVPASTSFRRSPYFTRLQKFHFENKQVLDRQGMRERYLSVSYLAALPPGKKARFTEELDKILERESRRTGRNRYIIPYDGEILWARRRAGRARTGKPRPRSGVGSGP